MVKKTQLPVVGGLRKVVQTGQAAPAGTTIAELGSSTITLAQLAQLLGNIDISTTSSGLIGDGTEATITLGPGLSGGGTLLGSVPIRLTAPLPFLTNDDGGEDGLPGRPGVDGKAGASGTPGAAIFVTAEDPEDSFYAIPGQPGTPGINGVGSPGPAGPAVMWLDDGWEDSPFVPGQTFFKTVNKGANWASNTALVAASVNVVYVSCPVPGTIHRVKMVTAGGIGSCVVDVWKVPFASFPPSSANSITAADLPTISGGTAYSDTALTGWNTTIIAGDVLAFVLKSSSVFTQITLVLEIAQ